MSRVAFFLLCLFAAFLPFEMLAAFEWLPSGAKMLGLACLAAGLLAFMTGHPLRMLSWVMTWRVALALWSGISFLWSMDREITLETIPRLGQDLILILLLWEFAVSYRDQLWLLRSLLLGMFVPLGMQLASFGRLGRGGENVEEMRVSGGGHDLNYLAMMFAVSIVIAVYLATNSSRLDRKVRWGYWGYTAAAVLGALLTGSRAGLACLMVTGFFCMLLAGFSLRRALQWSKYLVPASLLALVVRFVVPAALQSRLLEGTATADSFAVRIGYWTRGITSSFVAQPMTGVGLGGYSAVTTALTGTKTGVAHNVAISILVELGVVGIVLFLVFVVSLYRAAWHMPWREKCFALALLTVWLIASMSAGSQIDHFSWFLQGLVATMAAACQQKPQGGRSRPYPSMGLPALGRRLRPRFGKP